MTVIFHFHVLGSGSGGNATVLTFSDSNDHCRHILIDMGLGPRTSQSRARELGLDTELLEAIVLTHGDQDHCNPNWSRTLMRRELPVYVAPAHIPEALDAGVPSANIRRLTGTVELAGALRIRTAVSPHDREGTTALRIEHIAHNETPSRSLGWLTDLGCVVPEVEALIEGCDAIAIESNYDHEMQLDSPRPQFLKTRIMGGNGHLSNDQAHDVVVRLVAHSMPSAIVLLHLSRECNCPQLLQKLWQERSPELARRLHITNQVEPVGPIAVGEAVPDPDPQPKTLWV